jgi:hypothetical protein
MIIVDFNLFSTNLNKNIEVENSSATNQNNIYYYITFVHYTTSKQAIFPKVKKMNEDHGGSGWCRHPTFANNLFVVL